MLKPTYTIPPLPPPVELETVPVLKALAAANRALAELKGRAEVRAACKRGEESGLSEHEIALYDALAENESAVQVMGNDALKVIAHELLTGLKGNVTVDWSHRESARARMRALVKRILRKYGYSPDLQEAAVQTVLRQAEAFSAEWAA